MKLANVQNQPGYGARESVFDARFSNDEVKAMRKLVGDRYGFDNDCGDFAMQVMSPADLYCFMRHFKYSWLPEGELDNAASLSAVRKVGQFAKEDQS